MRPESKRISSLKIVTVLTVLVLASSSLIKAKSSLGGAPPPAPERWRGLIGEYGTDKAILYILEDSGKLCASFARANPSCLTEVSQNNFKFGSDSQHASDQVVFTRDK